MRSFCSSLPKSCGVYLFLDASGQVIYIGKAVDLRSRVSSYFASRARLGPKTRALVSRIDRVKTIKVGSELEALLLEARLVKHFKPRFNVELKDGKSYPFIKVTREKVPKVGLTREVKNDGARYFGPFPDVSAVRRALKLLRKMFPFRTCARLPQKPCLYFHLDLCLAPCTRGDVYRDCRRNIRYLLMFLRGKKRRVLKELEQEMQERIRLEDFESAQAIRSQIENIKYITQPTRPPKDYIENPNLLEDQRWEEMESLRRVLGVRYPLSAIRYHMIEAFDVSSISGKQAVGSMTVFVNGEPEKSSYRRFKIRMKERPDDTAMLGEVLRRRFKHAEWPKPDLVVVDGGAGQLGVATKVLKEVDLNIPVIGLAKKQEEVYIPKNEKRRAKSKKLRLPKNSPALHLIQRIRDEAHRFALAYHRKLRLKKLTT